MDGSHLSVMVHLFGEDTAIEMNGKRSEQNYCYKTDFGIRRENQDFGRQNNSMSLPPLDSTPIGMNTINVKTSPIDSISVETKTARTDATNTTNGVVNTTNGLFKAKRESAQTSGPGVRPIIFRVIIK